MSILGRWRIVEMPDYTDDYPDMMEPAYILFEDHGSGEFAFGCVTGQIFGGGDTDAVEFSWTGNDEDGRGPRRRLGRTPARRLPQGPNLLPSRRRSQLHRPPGGFFNSLLRRAEGFMVMA